MSPMPIYHCSSSYANGLLALLGLRDTGAGSIISALGLRAGYLLLLTYWMVMCSAPALCSLSRAKSSDLPGSHLMTFRMKFLGRREGRSRGRKKRR